MVCEKSYLNQSMGHGGISMTLTFLGMPQGDEKISIRCVGVMCEEHGLIIIEYRENRD